MDFKALLTFGWLKGWRTTAIVVIVVACYVLENFFGVDIPKVDFNIDDVLLALGLKAAAAHETTP